MGKPFKILILNMIHSLPIHLFYTLPNLTMILVMIREIKFIPPMTKITRKDKQSFRIIKIWCKYFSIVISHFFIDWSSHNWNYFSLFAQYFDNKRQMHLNTVLIFIIIDIQHMKSLLKLQFIHSFNIHLQRTQGSVELIKISQSTSWKIFMMSRTKYEYSFNLIGSNYILIRVCSRWSTIKQTSMWPNECFHPLFVLYLFGTIDILCYFRIQSCS